MLNDWSLRSATPEDQEQIRELLRLSLGDSTGRWTHEFWKWKHLENPFGESSTLVAEANQRVIGFRAFLCWNWKSGSADFAGLRAVDTATHPDWRGKGIFTRLTQELVERAKQEGYHFIYNTPNNQSMPGYLKMGWSKAGRTPVWIRVLKAGRVLKSLVTPGEEKSKFAENQFTTASALMQVSGLSEFLDRCNLPEARYHTVRTIDYLRWRYCNIPGIDYYSAWDMEQGKGAAIVFRKRIRRNLRELTLCELLISSSDERERARQLLRKLAADSNADYLSATCAARTIQKEVLQRSGFHKIYGVGPVLTVRVLNAPGHALDPLRWENWNCSIGDLELF